MDTLVRREVPPVGLPDCSLTVAAEGLLLVGLALGTAGRQAPVTTAVRTLVRGSRPRAGAALADGS